MFACPHTPFPIPFPSTTPEPKLHIRRFILHLFSFFSLTISMDISTNPSRSVIGMRDIGLCHLGEIHPIFEISTRHQTSSKISVIHRFYEQALDLDRSFTIIIVPSHRFSIYTIVHPILPFGRCISTSLLLEILIDESILAIDGWLSAVVPFQPGFSFEFIFERLLCLLESIKLLFQFLPSCSCTTPTTIHHIFICIVVGAVVVAVVGCWFSLRRERHRFRRQLVEYMRACS
mmetsp:Transcript_38764/g.54591  ORF Transcript_38764/g.54591 Transcript_38764/m.54591 type:complete len:232 (+) Transcript_38764:30-725(+)